ncbi:MAG TPA: hypothetical protein VNZ94_01965 [Xanthobacteraceae bacterium]|nr:hypothetical protein [Xanthobacteraceae bacterium]
MCLLCEDDTAYQAYMAYLDEMERQGQTTDPDKAMDALLDKLEAAMRPAADTTLSTHTPGVSASALRAVRSPFSCDPVDE